MAPDATFLGLDHHLGTVHTEGVVRLWARKRLQEKLMGYIRACRDNDRQASKLYGLANFFELGVFGCSGLNATKDRQAEKETQLTPTIRACLDVLEAVIRSKPMREVEVTWREVPRFLAASDAVLEAPRCGAGGFLIVWVDTHAQGRDGFVACLPPTLYDLRSPGDHQIAQLEMLTLMVQYAPVERAQSFKGRREIWYIDNVASLMTLVCGRSDS